MKNILYGILIILFLNSCSTDKSSSVLVETEGFKNKGGWFIDQQSMDEMGSPYLIAHGMGIPVEDAYTTVTFSTTGAYRMYVRTRNWTAVWSEKPAGCFQVLIDGKPTGKEFGIKKREWDWIDGGTVEINKLQTMISLHDLTGFNGRCDAIYFTPEGSDTPPNTLEGIDQMRKDLLDLDNLKKSLE